MENIIIWQIAGFVICFILLFVFIAKYHAALEAKDDLEKIEEPETDSVAEHPVFQSRAALLQGAQVPAALEVADLKEQVKTLHYHLEELKASTQKNEADMTSQLARLEARLGTFEQEVAKLQPTLLRVIEELEHIKGGEEPAQDVPAQADGAVAAPAEQPAPESASHSPVPELPEEELKF